MSFSDIYLGYSQISASLAGLDRHAIKKIGLPAQGIDLYFLLHKHHIGTIYRARFDFLHIRQVWIIQNIENDQ